MDADGDPDRQGGRYSTLWSCRQTGRQEDRETGGETPPAFESDTQSSVQSVSKLFTTCNICGCGNGVDGKRGEGGLGEDEGKKDLEEERNERIQKNERKY